MNGKIYCYFNRLKYEKEGIKKYYIGQTIKTIEERAGKEGSRYTREHNSKFSKAIKKWGWDAFECEILKEGIQTHEELNRAEINYIKKYDSYNNGYNSTIGGEGSSGFQFSEKSIQKLIDSKSKKVYCNELNMVFNSLKEAAKYIKLNEKSASNISKACDGLVKSAGSATINGKNVKLTWKYVVTDNDIDLVNNVNISDVSINNPNISKQVYCNELDMVFNSLNEAAEYVGLSKASSCNIALVCNKKRKYAGKFIINNKETKLTWKYMSTSNSSTNKTTVENIKVFERKQVYCNELDMVFNSLNEAAEYVGLSKASSCHISAVCNGTRKYAGKCIINNKETNLTWSFIDSDKPANNVEKLSNNHSIIKPITKRKVYCNELNIVFDSVREATEFVGLKSDANISRVCNGNKKHAGTIIINGSCTKLTWSYISEEDYLEFIDELMFLD